MITFELPTVPPSLNVYKGMHPLAQHRLSRRLWADVCAALALQAPGSRMRVVELKGRRAWLRLVSPASGRRVVRILRRHRRACDELDFDNLVGGCKPLVDALVKVGLLANDSPDSVTVWYGQATGSGCRVQVWSEEVTAPDESEPSQNRANPAESGPARAKVIPIKKRASGALFERRGV